MMVVVLRKVYYVDYIKITYIRPIFTTVIKIVLLDFR